MTKNHLDIYRTNAGFSIEKLVYGFTGRAGGVSPAPFAGLNMSFQRDDAPDNVLRNHHRLAHLHEVSQERVVRARQVHGTRVAVVDASYGGIQERVHPDLDGVDALVTAERGLMLVTTHADCVPVYVYDAVRGVVGLAHAGWRGAVSGVVEETIHSMVRHFGSLPVDLSVWFGPHIRSCCFEVGHEVLAAFRVRPAWNEANMLIPQKDGGLHLDLETYLRHVLERLGVGRISMEKPPCTCCAPERFFSHRGSGGNTGTGAAFIMLPEWTMPSGENHA